MCKIKQMPSEHASAGSRLCSARKRCKQMMC